jgi:hypothetical protein
MLIATKYRIFLISSVSGFRQKTDRSYFGESQTKITQRNNSQKLNYQEQIEEVVR